MRKLLLTAFALFVLTGITNAQTPTCTINTTYTTPGYYPDSILPPAYVTVPYQTVVQIKVLKDTTSPAFPGSRIPINYVQMDSVIGLPTGFHYATNPASGKFPGNSNGCLILYGTATAGQETGGPGSNGIYPMIVYYHANAQVPVAGPTNISGTNKKYHMTIMPASAGIASYIDLSTFNVLQNIPNPANGITEIQYWMPSANTVAFKLYSVLGNLVQEKTVASEFGNNKLTFDTSVLAPGIYLYSFQVGNKTVSKRMIVSAH
jgi:hypothetical protein